jgi:preprotein translocase subunit YajC
VYLIGLSVLFLLIILPQKRREKKAREMISALEVGDEITTIGGIVGKIVNINEDIITIETSAKKSQLDVKNWSVKDSKKAEANSEKKADSKLEKKSSK